MLRYGPYDMSTYLFGGLLQVLELEVNQARHHEAKLSKFY
jgi:hypothetical protein